MTAPQTSAAPQTWRAPAKINLWLAVTGRRADGYHLVDAGYQAIDLADTVTLETSAGEGVACRVEGEWAEGVPEGEDNLAARAARLFAQRTGHAPGLALAIRKNVPPAAGLGGGSSDAAAVLVALARRFALPDPERALVALAAGIGADVPFFLAGGSQRARGIGDELEPIEPPAERWGVLVHPGVGVSTAWAYRAWDESGAEPAQELSANWRARGNAFEPIVFARHPEVRRTAEILAGGPAAIVRMSGSGSAVFALYETEAARERDLARVAGEIRALPSARAWPFHFAARGVEPAQRGILKDSRAAGIP